MRTLYAVAATLAALFMMVSLAGCLERQPFSIDVEPKQTSAAPGGTVDFKVHKYGMYEILTQQWSADGGSITDDGVWTAPKEPGEYTIKAFASTGTNGGGEQARASATVTVAAEASPSPSPSEDVALAEGESEQIMIAGNGLAVEPGGTSPKFSIDRPRVIVEIMTYHWDFAGGKLGTIALKNLDSGETYGPWDAFGRPGQGGVKNAYWIAQPNEEIPAGTYKIIDSDPSSWASNAEAKGVGMAYVNAVK